MASSIRRVLTAALIIPLLALPGLAQPAAAAPSNVRVLFGGIDLPLAPGQKVFVENGVTMVPLRPLLTRLGFTVRWFSGSSTISATKCGWVNFQVGKRNFYNGPVIGRMPEPVRIIDGTAYAPLRAVVETLGMPVTWNGETRTVSVDPPTTHASPLHSSRALLELKRPGTLVTGSPRYTSDAREYLPGEYDWPKNVPTQFIFTPAGEQEQQTIVTTLSGTGFAASPDTRDMRLRVETASYFLDAGFEGAVRTALGKPSGPITDADAARVTHLFLKDTYTADDLCRLPNLSHLTIPGGFDQFDIYDLPIGWAPRLTHVTVLDRLHKRAPAGADTEATAVLPHRVETPEAVFLSDGAVSTSDLFFNVYYNAHMLSSLRSYIGLETVSDKPVIEVYGDETTWEVVTGGSRARSEYVPGTGRIRMTAVDMHPKWSYDFDEQLLIREYLRWATREVGKADLPAWLDEGLTQVEVLHWVGNRSTWSGPRLEDHWQAVTESRDTVPDLAVHTKQDAWTVTAVAYLLEHHGDRAAMAELFRQTRSGQPFDQAFRSAFGLGLADYQAEYAGHVAILRGER